MEIGEIFNSTVSLDNEPILASIVEEDEDQSDEDRLEIETAKHRGRSPLSQSSVVHERDFTVKQKELDEAKSMTEFFNNERSKSVSISDITQKAVRRVIRTKQ